MAIRGLDVPFVALPKVFVPPIAGSAPGAGGMEDTDVKESAADGDGAILVEFDLGWNGRAKAAQREAEGGWLRLRHNNCTEE